MKMPISEILDRLSITILKQLRTDHDMMKEILTYMNVVKDYKDCSHFLIRLITVNNEMWDLEAALRLAQEDELGLEEVGRRSLLIRDMNKKRVSIKNEIVEHYVEGFKDIKVNHVSE